MNKMFGFSGLAHEEIINKNAESFAKERFYYISDLLLKNKEEIEKQAKEMPSNFDDDGNLISRGNLRDVREGRAFPEALDKVFEETRQS